MKPYAQILRSIDADFSEALMRLRADPLFSSSERRYTDDDKLRIAAIWRDIVDPFYRTRRIIQSLYWRSFFLLGSKNSFVVKYASIVTYYTMVYELQKSFGPHEEFLRNYLSETFSENYGTLARYIYHIRFYAVLSYPREYFLTLRDEVDPSLSPLFDRREMPANRIEKRWIHDSINIFYHIRYYIFRFLTFIARTIGGGYLANLRFTHRVKGLIASDKVGTLEHDMHPGDILLTRQNWAATNMNIPGFWKHMSMYLGKGSVLKKIDAENATIAELDDNTSYIIEAVGTGIHIISLESLIGHNDYLGVIRTKLSREKIERSLRKSISRVGKEYDFSFNFYSDMSYVCSALVMKSYLPESASDEGLDITLSRIGLGLTYPPNDIVKKLKMEKGTSSEQLEYVGFIDAIEKKEISFLSTEEAFLESAFRSRLTMFLP